MLRAMPLSSRVRLPAALLLVLLSGCSSQAVEAWNRAGEGLGKTFGAILVFVIVAVVIYAIFLIWLLALLIVNVVFNVRGRQSVGWGTTALVFGGVSSLFGAAALLHSGHPAPGLQLLLGLALCGSGFQNVRARPPSAPPS